MNKKKTEIINISLNTPSDYDNNIDKLRISKSTIDKINNLIKENNMRIQRSNKKKMKKDILKKKASIAIKFLEDSAMTSSDIWHSVDELLIETDCTNILSLIHHVKTLLRKDGKWTLKRKKSRGKTFYQLVRYG